MTGKRGPKSKAKDKLMPGSWRAKLPDDGEVRPENPQSPRGDESAPAYLNKQEKEFWADFMPKALEMKTYSNADRFAFAMFCRAASDLLNVQAELQKTGTTYEVEFFTKDKEPKTAIKKHPLVDVERQKRDTFMKYSDQFGFNPLARTKLKIMPYQTTIPIPSNKNPDAKPIETDEFDDMMGAIPPK